MLNLGMKPSQVATLLEAAIPLGEPILVTGDPGVGKTSAYRQVTKRLGYDLIITHPVTEDTVQASGIPPLDPGSNGKTKLYGQHYRILNAKKPTFWLMDDIGQALFAVQAANMPWLLDRENGGHRLPDCVTVGAASNHRKKAQGVQGLLDPVKSRFLTIVEMIPDLDEFCYWGDETGRIPIEVIAYLRMRREHFHMYEPTLDLTNYACPRTWESAGKLIRMNLPADVEHIALTGAIGKVATEFSNFIRMHRKLPDLDAILLNPEKAPIPDKSQADVLWAISVGLAHKATVNNFNSIAVYAERLLKAERGEFATLLVKDSTRRDEAIQETKGFIRLMTGPLGNLISGSN